MNKRIVILGLAMVVGIVVAAVVGPAEAGSMTGASKMTVALDPSESKNFVDIFEGGRPAAVIVQGAGRGDVDCYLSTQDGNVVGVDVSPSNSCSFMWTPGETQGYRLRLVNAGRNGVLVDITNN